MLLSLAGYCFWLKSPGGQTFSSDDKNVIIFLKNMKKCEKSRKCFKIHKSTSNVSKTSPNLLLTSAPKNVIWQKIEKSEKNDKSDDSWVIFEKNRRRVRRSLWRPPLFLEALPYFLIITHICNDS